MGGLLRLLIVAGAVYLIYRGVGSLFGSTDRISHDRKDPLETTGTPLVQCTQCGKFIPEPQALRVSVRSKTRAFCSAECQADDTRGKSEN